MEAASILRRAEQKFELVAPDLGMLNAFQTRVARQKAEWMAEMAERRSGGAALIEVYQSTLLLIGWVLITTALAGMERFDRIKQRPISDVMTCSPNFAYESDPSGAALTVMAANGYRHVPVVDSAGRLVGIISPQRVADFVMAHTNVSSASV